MSTTSRQRIVTATIELLRRQGYGATSVKAIAAAAHAPMGSLYHYFPEGKKQIAAEALRSAGAVYLNLLPLLMDPHDDLPAAVAAYFQAAADDIEHTGWANMCPVGTVAAEIADTEPGLREVAAEVVELWIGAGARYMMGRTFAGGRLADARARELVQALLGALEGAFVLARTVRSAEPLLAAGRALMPYAATLVTPTPAGRSTSNRSDPVRIPPLGGTDTAPSAVGSTTVCLS